MNNLFDKLKPEIKALMEAETGKYPNYVNGLKKHLKENYCVVDLRYQCILSLENYYREAFKTRPVSAFEFFLEK